MRTSWTDSSDCMPITLKGLPVFCRVCASMDLELVEDELLASIAKSKYAELVRCDNCGNFFSKDDVEDNFDSFTDTDERNKIFEAKLERSARYRKFDEERLAQIKKDESDEPKSRGRRRKKIDLRNQRTLFREEIP